MLVVGPQRVDIALRPHSGFGESGRVSGRAHGPPGAARVAGGALSAQRRLVDLALVVLAFLVVQVLSFTILYFVT